MAERVRRRLSGATQSPLVARARRLPAGAWFIVLMVAALLFALIVSLVVGHSPDKIDYQVTGLPSGGDATHYLATYEVTKAPLAEARCHLEALDIRHDVVGDLVDTVGPRVDSRRTTQRQVQIDTRHQAVSASVLSCTIIRTR